MTSNTMTVAEIVQICQNTMAMENATVQSIRGLFLTIEAVALGVATVLISVRASQLVIVTRPEIMGLTIIGLFIALGWFLQIRQRTEIVDQWKARIYDYTQKTEISAYYEDYKSTRLHIRSVRLWLDFVAPFSVVTLWVIVFFVGCPA